MKKVILKLWSLDSHIRGHLWLAHMILSIPVVGRYIIMVMDRVLYVVYGIDMDSSSIRVKALSIAHPSGVLLGGNGIVSEGRVAVLADVKFVGKSPSDPKYVERHRQKNVFALGDNVVIGTGVTILGPVTICDNVIIGAMSLVNKDILEPGTYTGVPAKKVSDKYSDEWVNHL